MTLKFPIQTFSKSYASNKYNEIISVIFQITGVKYSSHSIRNYFHRVRTNDLKGFGKSNGTCRWNYYQAKVKSFTDLNSHYLEEALNGFELEESLINSVMQQLIICTEDLTEKILNMMTKNLTFAMHIDCLNWKLYLNLQVNGLIISTMQRIHYICISLITAQVTPNGK